MKFIRYKDKEYRHEKKRQGNIGKIINNSHN